MRAHRLLYLVWDCAWFEVYCSIFRPTMQEEAGVAVNPLFIQAN